MLGSSDLPLQLVMRKLEGKGFKIVFVPLFLFVSAVCYFLLTGTRTATWLFAQSNLDTANAISRAAAGNFVDILFCQFSRVRRLFGLILFLDFFAS